MYKMIAVDLDGTMLNSYGEVTENTKRVIKQTIGKGTDVIIASGRSIDSIKGIAQEIGSSKYMIAGNGAVVYDIKNNKIIYEKYIPKNKALDIIKICEQNSIYYNVYTNKSIIADGLRYNVLYYYKENLKKEDSKKTHITLVDNIKKYVEEMKDERIMKIFICDSTKSIFNSIVKKFAEIQDVEILDVSHMSRKVIKHGTVEVPIEYYYTEISMQNVDKWYALEFLIDKLGIKKDEVIAIGDNTNDKKMIEQAGLGIIMKGSTPVVTEVADFVTDDNNNEGVARAIERFIF
jgi:Cof subfamily protein (haloacid dehalogenase superfamily)